MMRRMTLVMRVVCDKEGNGDGYKSEATRVTGKRWQRGQW
jgi:hypothetical protein